MRFRLIVLFGLTTMLACATLANDKKKPVLPATILNARTVAVIIDPDAGVSADDPLGNKTALEDVEKAFANWGRFRPVFQGMTPDLVVVIRKGNGKPVQPTVHGGTSTNDRPVIIQPNDTGIRVGGQKAGRRATTLRMTHKELARVSEWEGVKIRFSFTTGRSIGQRIGRRCGDT